MNPTRKILLVSTTLAAALSIATLADANGPRKTRQMREEIARYEESNERLKAEVATLRHELELLQKNGDPRALERAAREKLGLVRPGELVFNFDR